jgi:hypothetical protein
MGKNPSDSSFPDDLTPDEMAADLSPARPRRRRTGAARNLGVYDADRDILDQYLFEVSKTPLLSPQ